MSIKFAGCLLSLLVPLFIAYRLGMGFGLRPTGRRILLVLFAAAGGLCTAFLGSFALGGGPVPVFLQWWLRLLFAGGLLFLLETGFTRLLPDLRGAWVVAAASLTLAAVMLLPSYLPDAPRAFARLLLFIGAYVGLHMFILWRLRGLQLSLGRMKLPLVLCYGLAAGLFPLYFIHGPRLLLWPAGIWMGCMGITGTCLAGETVLSRLIPSRRRTWLQLALVASLALVCLAFYNGTRTPRVRHLHLHLGHLPPAARGFRLVHLSDLHLGGVESLTWLRQTVAKVNALHADAVVITGDFFDRDVPEGKQDIIKRLRATYGILAVPGNHEFYMDVDRAARQAGSMKVRMLRNEHVNIAPGIQIAGIDDPMGFHFHNGGPDIAKALAGTSPDQAVILLSHRPVIRLRGRWHLQLAGHFHSGQIPPLSLLLPLVHRYSHGLYRMGAAYLYVSPGTGVWGMPMRLFSRSEITCITLLQAAEK